MEVEIVPGEEDYVTWLHNKPHFYDYEGNPIPGDFREATEQWGRLKHSPKMRVGGTIIRYRGIRYWVSTVYLGMDHGMPMPGQIYFPLIYELMVFRKGTFYEYFQERYPSRETARLGHERIAARSQTSRIGGLKLSARRTSERILSNGSRSSET